jgi:hypothetical protein
MRVRTVLSGWQGAPGLATHYFLPGTPGGSTADAVDVAGRVRAFWVAAAAIFTTTVGMQTSGSIDLIEETNGLLVGGLSGGSPAGVSGSAASTYLPLASMVLLRLQTGIIVNGRRVQGHINLGPAAASTSTANGVPTASAGTAATNAGAALGAGATASHPVVWHRPHLGIGSPGQAVSISGYQAGPEFAVLRSRRD